MIRRSFSLARSALSLTMIRRSFLLTLATSSLIFGGAVGQTVPEAAPDDVRSLDGIIHALYDVISGPAGQERDWNRMRSLFIPDARLIPSGPNQAGEFGHTVLTLEQWIERSGPFLIENGFFEVEIGRTTDQWGPLAQMFSSYDSRRNPDEEPFARGINSIQTMHDGERWWIVTVFWTAERGDLPIPERYLGG